MLMSLAVVFFGMQLMFVGPLKGRLDSIQTRLELSETSMKKLVSTRDTVWRTNDLLSGLDEQASRWGQLKDSLADMQNLRNRVTQEGQAATVALSSLDRISNVQKRLINEQDATQHAARHLAELHELRSRIIRGSDQTDVAVNSLDGIVALQNRVIAAANGYDDASKSVAQLADLTQRLVAQSDELRLASERFDQFVALSDKVNAAATGLESVEESVDQLVALKDQIVAANVSDDVKVAHENVRVMIAMNDQLNSDSIRLDAARENLNSLFQLQQVLGQQSAELAVAIQNLEIMDDFQTEVAAHVQTLSTLRRTLLDIAMMESTMGRVARVIEPLSEIGNLRRLSETEVREAARVILDRRMTRFTQAESASGTDRFLDPVIETDDEPVPLPPEAR